MLGKYFMRSLLTNKALWGWGVGFMAFWLIMGAFVFSSDITTKTDWLTDASVWFSLIGLIAGSIIATPVSLSIYYGNASLAYGFRYTRLKPSSYIFDLMTSTSMVSAIIGCFIIVFSVIFFSGKSGYLLLPSLPVQAILLFFLSGVFMFLFSVVIVVLVNDYLGLKSISFVAAVPQLFSYVFGFSELGVPLPKDVVYASPFSDIPRLLYTAFSGHVSTFDMSNATGSSLNSYILLASLLTWIAIMFIAAMFLIRRIRPMSIEEGRQV